MEDTFEIITHIDEVTNLELLRKGLYRLEVTVECDCGDGKRRAEPVGSLVAPICLQSKSRALECYDSDELTEPGYIDEVSKSYVSRAVLMRYIDECFHMGEAAQFMLQLPRSAWWTVDGSSANPQCYVVLNLLRADFGNVDSESDAAFVVKKAAKRTGKFEKLASRTIQVPLVSRTGGLPLQLTDAHNVMVFDSMNLCQVGFSVHTCLLSTRFNRMLAPALPPALRPPSSPPHANDESSSAKVGIRGWLSSLTGTRQSMEPATRAEDHVDFHEYLFPCIVQGRLLDDADDSTVHITADDIAKAIQCVLEPLVYAAYEIERRDPLFRKAIAEHANSKNTARMPRFRASKRDAASKLYAQFVELVSAEPFESDANNAAFEGVWHVPDAEMIALFGDRSTARTHASNAFASLCPQLMSFATTVSDPKNPQTVTSEIQVLTERVASLLENRWRKLHRCLAHSFGSGAGWLQTLFYASLRCDVSAIISKRTYPPTTLIDMDAAAPLRIKRSAKRHLASFDKRSNVPIHLRLMEHYPLSLGFEPLAKFLAVTEYTYVAHAGQAHADKHRASQQSVPDPFTDDDDEEVVDLDASHSSGEGIRHEEATAHDGGHPATTHHYQVNATSAAAAALRHYAPARESVSTPGTEGGPSPFVSADTAAAVEEALPTHVHAVIFLNGLGGSMHDTRVIRSYLKLYHPEVCCYVSMTNQSKATEGDIIEAGARVAREISEILTFKLAEDGLTLSKWSIVAFSMGGVVARLALRHPALRELLPRAHAFISIASPHMGVLYSQSTMVSAGMFVFQKWRSSHALAQLSFTDEDTSTPAGIRNCFLYLLAKGWNTAAVRLPSTRVSMGDESIPAGMRIFESEQLPHYDSPTVPPGRASSDVHETFSASEESGNADYAGESRRSASSTPTPGSTNTLKALTANHFGSQPNGHYMKHFKHIIMLSSEQDSYAPWHSCAAVMCEEARKDSRNGAAYTEMLNGFFDGVAPERVRRWDVHYKQLSSIFAGKITLDSVLGREAHVAFLESEQMSLAISIGLSDVWDI